MATPTPSQQGQTTSPARKPSTKCRQIRALYDAETITVYQAYNSEIAAAAVAQQKLCASPSFRLTRMTWIKPSWCWMMYRAGYSYKDKNQERILALKMTHRHFTMLLEKASLAAGPASSSKGDAEKDGVGGGSSSGEKSPSVRVQWDPERSPRLEKRDYRSIQIGIPGPLAAAWAEDWIVGIEDVTESARALERELRGSPDVTEEELVRSGLLPLEREYIVPARVQEVIGMV
ncbi:hypothetical protein SLS62_002437 [Diatrype stigma]|uniref:ATP-dependent RNA helicase DHX8 n=1 Tax=Diatrype stigma TaxID=117547 RepID=A0AAN9UUG1_9PEZI